MLYLLWNPSPSAEMSFVGLLPPQQPQLPVVPPSKSKESPPIMFLMLLSLSTTMVGLMSDFSHVACCWVCQMKLWP